MIKALSYVIAVILTVLLVCILYPIAGIFWIIGKIGDVVGVISDWIFTHANSAIKQLWSELRKDNQQ